MWHLPSLLRIANLVQYPSLLLRKIVQMWYLLHICCNLASLVNPFFLSSDKQHGTLTCCFCIFAGTKVNETAETETETGDDAEGENVIEVTSEGTCWAFKTVGCSPDVSS